MSATICGHDREELRSGLRFANASTLDEVSRGWSRPDDSAGALLFDVHDPAKLAAILAELLRERGIRIESSEGKLPRIEPCFGRIEFVESTAKMSTILAMPQARRLALALLDEPNATAQDVERMIEEATP